VLPLAHTQMEHQLAGLGSFALGLGAVQFFRSLPAVPPVRDLQFSDYIRRPQWV
jgi:hypothetical protein